MSYQPTVWKDRIVEKPRTFDVINNPDGSITLEPKPGTVLQEGTPVNAANLNKLEQGLVSHMADYVRQAGYAVTSGTSTAYTATLDPAPASIVEGFSITIVPHVDCGASPTLNINGKGAIALRNNEGEPFAAGDLKAGTPYNFRKVGNYFFASSGGGGVKIDGLTEETIIYGESISKGQPIKVPAQQVFFAPGETTMPLETALGGSGQSIAFAPNAPYVVIGLDESPYAVVYTLTESGLTNRRALSGLYSEYQNDAAVAINGTHIALVFQDPPYLAIYKRNANGSFTKLSNPTTMPSGYSLGVAFSPDGLYLAVAQNSSPYVLYYKRSEDVFTCINELPHSPSRGVAFSPDGQYLAVAHQSSPYVSIYKRSGDSLTKLPNPDVLPAGGSWGAYRVAFSDNYLAVRHYSSPYLTVYKRNGDSFVKLANPTTIPSGWQGDVSFAPPGPRQYLAVSQNSNPYLLLYYIDSNDTLVKMPNPATLPEGESPRLRFSENYLGVVHSLGSHVTVYRNETVPVVKKATSMADLVDAAKAGFALEAGDAWQSKKVAIIFQ